MRVLKAMLVLAVLAATATLPTGAGAQGAGILLAPPFTEQRTVIGALREPCAHEDTAPPSVTDPAAGRLAPLAAGVEVEHCSLYGKTEHVDWTLGEVPLPLVGRPAHVVAVFEGPAVARATGTGHVWASLAVKLGTASVEGSYFDVVAARCKGNGCTASERGSTWVVTASVPALPAVLHAIFRADAGARNGTGRADATMTAELKAVMIVPQL